MRRKDWSSLEELEDETERARGPGLNEESQQRSRYESQNKTDGRILLVDSLVCLKDASLFFCATAAVEP